MKPLMKVCINIYHVRFLVETDANTVVDQQNMRRIELAEALVTRWIASIQLSDFDLKFVLGRMFSGPDNSDRWPRGEGDPKLHVENGPEERIEGSLWGIQVEQEPGWKRPEKA